MCLVFVQMELTICLLHGIAFLDLLAVGLIVPLVPSHVRQMGGNHIYVGLLASIYAGFQLGSGPLIGSLSDIKGRRTILIITLLVCTFAYTILGLTSSIIIILLIRALLGLFKQTQILTKALVPDYIKNEQKQSAIYGKMAAISSAGMSLGPVIGGHIIEDNPDQGFTIIAMVVGICFLINAGFVYILPKSNRYHLRKKPHTNFTDTNNIPLIFLSSIKQSFAELYKIDWLQYWDIFLFKFLVAFAMSIYYSNYSLYLKTQYELSPKYIGYIISFQGVMGSLSSYFMGFINSFYTNDRNYSLRNFHVFLILTISIIGMILSFNVYVYIFFLIPLAIGNSVSRLVTLEMVLKRSHGDHRGTLIGASNSVRALSGVIAPMIAGLLGQYAGVSYVIYASLGATIVGLILSNQRQHKIKMD